MPHPAESEDRSRVVREAGKDSTNYAVSQSPSLAPLQGPNGSGKSSISCALGVALGGSLNAINRQGRHAHLVRANDSHAREAVVTVKIARRDEENDEDDVVVVVRIPNDAGQKPSHFLNGVPTAAVEIAAFAAGLGIRPDNLMQFLAQDAVRDFPKIQPQVMIRKAYK
jgi:chromosome segregation ATPase